MTATVVIAVPSNAQEIANEKKERPQLLISNKIKTNSG